MQTCPKCSAEVPVQEGLRAWCERCDWNVAGDVPQFDEGFFARQYVRIGEHYGKAVLEKLKTIPAHKLRPRWTLQKCIAFLLAASVHVLSLALLTSGLLLIAIGYPAPSLVLFGAATCAIAWFMRPDPGKVPAADLASEKDFPALHKLVNQVARDLGGQPIKHIVVNEDFNAAYGVYGWRRVPVLWIGLPLWVALKPQERLALLGHEVAHGVNGDGTRSFIVWSALHALDEWIGILQGPLRHASTPGVILGGSITWLLSLPFALLQSLLAQLLWLDKQQAEYFADYLGSMVAGTPATISALQRLMCAEHLTDVLLRNAYSRSQSGAYILGLFRQRLETLPAREWQRLARSSQREGARLDASHPPTAYRIEFLAAHSIAEPSLGGSESTMAQIDKELDALREPLGNRLIARHAHD
jgi:heat shock protein HtpX